MKITQINTKRIIAFILSLLLVMQQSFAFQVLATEITDANNNPIKNGGGNTWNIRPDAVNGDVGFKQFGKIDLSKGDVLNFIYNYLTQTESGTANNLTLEDGGGNINTFINLVNNGVNINGIVNALQSVNGALKTNGNMVFISPNGMVVGSSGVLNVGNLSVVTPTQGSYDKLSQYLNLPKKTAYYASVYHADYDANDPEGTSKIVVTEYDYTKTLAQQTNTGKTFNISTLTDGAGNVLSIDGTKAFTVTKDANGIGKVAARGNVTINAGSANINGILLAGVNDATVVSTENAAAALFNSLVKTEDFNANKFSNANGNIVIKSVGSTNIGGTVRNHAISTNAQTTIEAGNGINISGELSNRAGNMSLKNNGGQLLVASAGRVNSNGTNLLVQNDGTLGMDIQGIVKNTNAGATVNFINNNSNMKLGHANNNFNIDSNAKVNIAVTNGDLLNNGVNKTLIRTTNGANLDITVTNGKIGTEVGPCDGTTCTGIGTNGRDLAKSINTNIAGNIKAVSTKGARNTSLVNMASLDTNMNVDQIKADGRVILLADGSGNLTSNGNNGTKTNASSAYNIINKASNSANPNVEGTGISLIASGTIGETGKALTFRQNGTSTLFPGDDATQDHVLHNPTSKGQGVDMLAIGDINVKGLDADGGKKLDTNVCAMISREGNVNAEFSGDVYIGETTAAKEINITTRGKNMYIEHLGETSKYKTDYYGENKNINPTKAKLVALDLGSKFIDSEKPEYESASDSTIVVKNGTIKGQGNGRPSSEQDLLLVADNAYAGGYYFNMGKHRGEIPNKDPENLQGHKFNPSYYVKDGSTNTLKNANDASKPVSIRAKAVRPKDVEGIGDIDDRNYYYGGSSQGYDDDYDGVNGNKDLPHQGGEQDDDNLVVPDKTADTDTDNDLDTDIDTDLDNDTDTDMDMDTDTDTDHDGDDQLDTDTDEDTDTDTDTDMDDEPDVGDTDSDSDTDTDTDTDADSDTDIDADTDTDTDHDGDDQLDTDTDEDTDTDTDTDMDDEPDNGDTDSDSDTDTDTDTDADSDTDIDADTDTDTDHDGDDQLDTDTDNDTDTDTDTDMDDEPDNGDTDSDSDTDTDTDTDADSDTDIDADTDTDTDHDGDDQLDTDTDNDTDNDTDTDMDDEPDKPIEPERPDEQVDLPNFKDTYKQRVVTDRVDSIDKRQYMRFNADESQNLITFESNENVVAVTDISRGGVSLKHNKKLKVGDVVPIHLKYGDLEVNANVKIVSASDVKAGAQFINLDKATANKLLYLSLLQKDQTIAQTIENVSASVQEE